MVAVAVGSCLVIEGGVQEVVCKRYSFLTAASIRPQSTVESAACSIVDSGASQSGLSTSRSPSAVHVYYCSIAGHAQTVSELVDKSN